MRKLRKVDIESMERELEVLTKEQERQIRGGRIVYESTGDFNANRGKCVLYSIDYLSEASLKDIEAYYINMKMEGGQWTEEEIKSSIKKDGLTTDALNILYDEFVLGSDTGLIAEQYSVDNKNKEYDAAGDALLEQLARYPKGTPGSLMSGSAVTLGDGETINNALSNMGHSIVIIDYDKTSKIVQFWDEGNSSFGTCHISDLDCFTTAVSGSTDNL